jgi:hypothetical protein
VGIRSGRVRGQQRHIRARIEAWRAQQKQKQKQTVRAGVYVRACVRMRVHVHARVCVDSCLKVGVKTTFAEIPKPRFGEGSADLSGSAHAHARIRTHARSRARALRSQASIHAQA